MQNDHSQFMEALHQVDQLLSKAENNEVKLGLSLSDISKIHHLQYRLFECKILNTLYSEESRLKSLINKKANINLQLQENLQNYISDKTNTILEKFKQLDMLILYILNQTITKDIMRNILSQISQIILGSQHFTILRQINEKIECVSTNVNIEANFAEEFKEKLFITYRGEDQKLIQILLDDENLINLFGSKQLMCIRAIQRLASTTECTLILFHETSNSVVPYEKHQQVKNIADQIISMAYDLIRENYHKDELISQVRTVTQFIIKNGPHLSQEIIRKSIIEQLHCTCNIIQSQRHGTDSSYAVTDNVNNLYIPVMYENNLIFYVQMQSVSIDIITFSDFVTQLWQRFQHILKEYKDKEFLYQIIEVSTPSKVVLTVDPHMNLLYQSGQVPLNWGFLNLGSQQIDQFLNITEAHIDEEYLKNLLECISELKSSRKSFMDMPSKTFPGEKTILTQIYVKKDELGEIMQFFIIIDQMKKRGEKRSTIKEERNFELQQEALVTLKMDKIEKACQTLQEMLHSKLTAFQIIDLIHEKSIQSEIEQEQEQYHSEIAGTYLYEYLTGGANASKPAASVPKQSLRDMDAIDTAKNLVKENQLKPNNQIFQLRQEDLELLKDYSFDIMSRETEVMHYMQAMFHLLNYEDRYQIEQTTLYQFLVVAQEKYNQNMNPFHNFQHAFTVAHCCFYIIRNKLLDIYLDSIEQFSCFLAAVCHDLEHTGRTNNFEVASMSKLAIRYNDESVLENHHASTAFKIMQKDQYNILSNLSVQQFQIVRKYMVHNILATDMKKHFALLQQFEMKMKNGEDLISRDEDKLQLAGLIVHTCDLTGPTKRFEIAKKWSMRIQQEFDNQVEEEKFVGLPVTQYLVCQSLPKQELSFIRVIIRPMFVITSKVLENGLQIAIDNLDKNMKDWEKMLANNN